jgi:hypothetical protein
MVARKPDFCDFNISQWVATVVTEDGPMRLMLLIK